MGLLVESVCCQDEKGSGRISMCKAERPERACYVQGPGSSSGCPWSANKA